MNVRSWRDCLRKVPPFTVLYTTWRKLADYQFQRWDSFYIQGILLKNLLWQHQNSRERRLLLDSGYIWCMELAYVDKLAKDNNGVKYLLVRQDLFDRTVNAKGMKTEDSQKTVKAFSSIITTRNRPKKIGLTRGPNLLERSKSFVLLRGYKFTLLWVRLGRFLLNVQYDLWKIFFTVTWKISDKSIWTNHLNLSLP